MLRLLTISLICFLLVSMGCSKKNYLDRSDEARALQDAIRSLQKDPKNQNAADAIPILYKSIQQKNLSSIKRSEQDTDLAHWDKILQPYQQLQQAYDGIMASSAASALVTPTDYSSQIDEIKNQAADAYYQAGSSSMNQPGRTSLRTAYDHFEKANRYRPGYKDASAKMQEAFDLALIHVLILPVEDNSFFMNRGWSFGSKFNNEYFEQNLLRDLNNRNRDIPARYYAEWEMQRNGIRADRSVSIRLRNLDIPQPFNRQYNRQASKQVQNGTDTLGKPIYQTVYATVYINQMSFTARGQMDIQIRDHKENSHDAYRSFQEDYYWQEETASYRGDSRALSQQDWALINRSGFNTPRQEDIVREIYRRLYPSVKNYLEREMMW